jgi:large subunit ribosomal protein L25
MALSEAGSTALIDLYVDQEPKPNLVLARDLQQEPVTGRLQHVDFFQVRLTEKVKTSPRIEVVGQSPLVQSGGAVLVQILDQLEVECLPTDLISSIQVDVSGMESVEDSITISELAIPPTVTVMADPDDVVVSLVPPRMARVLEEITEEEAVPEEAIVEEVELEEIEVEEEAEPEA